MYFQKKMNYLIVNKEITIRKISKNSTRLFVEKYGAGF